MAVCSKCGAQNEEGIKFCSECGAEMTADDVFSESAAPEAAPVNDSAPAAPVAAPPVQETAVQNEPPQEAEGGKRKKKKEKEPIPKGDRTLTIFALLSLIFSCIGVFAGGFGCLFSFVSIKTAIIFYAFSILGIIFGIIAMLVIRPGGKYKGKLIAIVGLVIGIGCLLFWVIASIILKNMVYLEFGSAELMDLFKKLSELTAAK